MNIPKSQDSRTVVDFLGGYLTAGGACGEHPEIDDILSGTLELKPAGSTSTRTMSRQVLFHVLQQCQTIDVASINRATNGRYAYSTEAAYAALARVASTAIGRFIERLPKAAVEPSIKGLREAIDAPYHEELQALDLL